MAPTASARPGATSRVVAVAAALSLAVVGLPVYLLLHTTGAGVPRQPWDCGAACAHEPLAIAEPDGLTGFGALLPVWNAHHELEDASRWYPQVVPAGYLPARAADQSAAGWIVDDVGYGNRVDDVHVHFWVDVVRTQGRALMAPEMPADALPAAIPDSYGCGDADIYRSATLDRSVGAPVVIRVAYDPDWANGYTDRFDDARVRILPAGQPCELVAS